MSRVTLPTEVWDQEIASLSAAPTDWLWHGFLAAGCTTLLTSQWKSGKTTLLSMLLSRRKQGGTLAGLAVKPGRSAIVSEEPTSLWAARISKYDFGGQVCFLCRPFLAIPTPDEWQTLIDRILHLRQSSGIDLVVIDPLAPCLRQENQARGVLETLMPLTALTRAGIALMLLHHPARGHRPIGQAARGSGALLGHVDISIEMRHPGGNPMTRRRRFLSLSRHAETPRKLLLEWNAEGTDYLPVESKPEEDFFNDTWTPLRLKIMPTGRAPFRKLTRQDILGEWPDDFEKPKTNTLWRWLDQAFKKGQVACQGKGSKSDPFRYWLPAREEFLRPEGGGEEALRAWNARCVEEAFARLDQASEPTPAEPMTLPGNEGPSGLPAAAPVPAEMPPEPPPPDSGSQSAVTASPTAAPVPSPAAQPVAAEASVRLPYPFNLMNPADVPEQVWKQARRRQGNPG